MNFKEKLKEFKEKSIGNLKIKEHSNSKISIAIDNFNEKDHFSYLENLNKFKEEKISPAAKAIAEHFTNTRNISLNAKIDDYIDWYYKNMVKGKTSEIGEYDWPIELRNFIEKMAVWYELRYPTYEITRLMTGCGQEFTKINDVMFNSNIYINELFDKDSDIRLLDWDEFYNTKAFINSLPWEERYIFQKPRYSTLVYIDPEKPGAHLHLSSNGIVQMSEGIGEYSNFKVSDDKLKGMHIKKVVELLKEKDVVLPSNNELEKTIEHAEKWRYQKEGMLDCVMYRIIERGGNRIGPRRGLLFAKEFGRNIDIPMMYGIDYTDPGLRNFVNEYIEAGGSKDLMCYVGYFQRAGKNIKLDTVSVQELIRTRHNNYFTKYTPEETELHQRIVNTLAKQYDQEEVEKEKVKQLRLQRRLEKSRNAKR